MSAPRITVLMSVYNGGTFLPPAVQSVLTQTFRDFEFLIIDDGSTDESAAYLAQLCDPRVRVVRHTQNLGLTQSLQHGVELAQGEFLARLDADDLAAPDRLARQTAYLDQHPAIGLSGSAARQIDNAGRPRAIYRVPLGALHVRWTSLLANPFVHSTVMLRRKILLDHQLNYDPAFRTTQDYELWTRLLRHTEAANLPDCLVSYRQRDSITHTRRESQLRNHDVIALRTIRAELPEFAITAAQVSDLRAIFIGGPTEPGLSARRTGLADLCLDMLGVFARQHQGQPELISILPVEVARIVRFFLRPPLPGNTGHILKRATQLAPLWPSSLATLAATGATNHLRYGVQHD